MEKAMVNYLLVVGGLILLLVLTNPPTRVEYVFYNLVLDVLEMFGVEWEGVEKKSGNKLYDFIKEKIFFLLYYHIEDLRHRYPEDYWKEKQFAEMYEKYYLNKKEE